MKNKMKIEYKVIEHTNLKNGLKNKFQVFFFEVFGQRLEDQTWEHQFIHSPYEESPLFLAMHAGTIVGSALMIPQKLMMDGKCIDYYLYTTSAILKAYRKEGIYVELLAMQREHCTAKNKAFIFAFPNKLAYTVLKLFGGFKDIIKTNLVKAKVSQLDFMSVGNSLLIDKPMFNWRFEHKTYNFFSHKKHIVIGKYFEGNLDVLAIYDDKVIEGIDADIESLDATQDIVTLECFLKEDSDVEQIQQVHATYFPVDCNHNPNTISINLLMSDVF